MGVPDADGSRPVIELTTDHVAIVSATGCCFQNLEFRQPVRNLKKKKKKKKTNPLVCRLFLMASFVGRREYHLHS